MIKLPEGESFNTLDVASICNVKHSEVRRRFENLMRDEKLPVRKYEGVKPNDGGRSMLAYELSEAEFIYLVFKIHTGNIEDFSNEFMDFIIPDKEVSKANVLFRNIKITGSGLNMSLEIGGLSVGNKDKDRGKTTLEQVGVDMMRELFPDDY